MFRLFMLLAVSGSALAASGAQAFDQAWVERRSGSEIKVRWDGAKTVDVYMAEKANASLKTATLVSKADADGEHVLPADTLGRRYLLLHDKQSGEVRRVAERLMPLEAGSNFRDLGGYPAAGGKHVRWGMVYRSAGQPMLNDRDLALIRSLSLANLVDLRSMEERRLAPTRIAGVPYNAIGYPFMSITSPASRVPGAAYRNFPELMAPHLKLILNKMLGEGTPLAFNCSAGQDRTGFVAAMILTALGVPGEVVLEDYHLTTVVRQPQFEMQRIDPVASANDPVALMFAGYQKADHVALTPLRDAQGKAFLTQAFEAIEAQYGSVDAYLEREAGLTPARRKTLRSLYLQ
jgi:protein-tyrosine phosphatase